MKKIQLLNAFSINMLSGDSNVLFRKVDVEDVIEELTHPDEMGFESAVGHADTASIFSEILGLPVPCERRNVSLEEEDVAFVGQYKGPRLPEGTTSLPEEAEIVWWKVTV
jgi:hypothetical protein